VPGTHSSRRINELARQMGASTYLEIGVAKGQTFFDVAIPDKTAVDPNFRFDWRAHQTERVRFHQEPSDAYFKKCQEKFDIVFLDGHHVFEQTFRDCCNALIVTHDKSVIIIDDTVPNDIYSAWPDAQEATKMRQKAGGKSKSWHGDVFKIVYAIHDFFLMLSYCTINTDGNPQTFVWRERREDFRPRFNSLETISRMTWFHMQQNLEVMKFVPEPEGLPRVSARSTA
jgi:hypothetical protein